MPSDPLHHLRTVEVYEVAFLLKCSHETVRRYIRQGKLPAIMLGDRSLRVRLVDLEAFMEAQTLRIAAVEREIDAQIRSVEDLQRRRDRTEAPKDAA